MAPTAPKNTATAGDKIKVITAAWVRYCHKQAKYYVVIRQRRYLLWWTSIAQIKNDYSESYRDRLFSNEADALKYAEACVTNIKVVRG
jgi:hypothetical protein